MEIFNFPLHMQRTEYPETGAKVKFGRGYTFALKADAPPERKFVLMFEGFKYYATPIQVNGVWVDQIDYETNANFNNFGALEQFYQRHELSEPFIYPHPVYGNLMCRFDQPLLVPKPIKGGNGMLEPFELQLIEMPV